VQDAVATQACGETGYEVLHVEEEEETEVVGAHVEPEDLKPTREASTKEAAQVSVTFDPREGVGIHVFMSTGQVKKVREGEQAERLGVQAGWEFFQLDGQPYSEKLFKDKIDGTCPYTATFRVPPATPSGYFSRALWRRSRSCGSLRKDAHCAAPAAPQDRKAAVDAFLAEHKFADINSATKSMLRTTYPLHVAAELRDRGMVGMLLAEGADPRQKNSAGKTAFQVAQEKDRAGSHVGVLIEFELHENRVSSTRTSMVAEYRRTE
jgi:hypothetical protein